MGEVPLRAFELPPFQTSHRVRAQIVWPSTSRCQSRPNAGKAAHDRVPPAEAGIQGSAVQTARARLSLLPSVCYSGPLRAGSTEGVAFLGIALCGRPAQALCSTWGPVRCVSVGGDCPCSKRTGWPSYGSRGERSAVHSRDCSLTHFVYRSTVYLYGNGEDCKSQSV